MADSLALEVTDSWRIVASGESCTRVDGDEHVVGPAAVQRDDSQVRLLASFVSVELVEQNTPVADNIVAVVVVLVGDRVEQASEAAYLCVKCFPC